MSLPKIMCCGSPRTSTPTNKNHVLRVDEDVDPYKHCVKHPYEKKPNANAFRFLF